MRRSFFAHLLGEVADIWGQQYNRPQGRRMPTSGRALLSNVRMVP
jgi:hypothetical protein